MTEDPSALTPDQLVELRAELERQIHRLERSMRITDEAAAPVTLDQTAVGRLSRMDALQNQGLTKNLQERERARFALLREALERMEDGTFGACTLCGAAIPFGRLFVVPETPACASCGDDARG